MNYIDRVMLFTLFQIACVAAWCTHILVCIKTGAVLFLIAGALCFPVGIIHGSGIWFGLR